MPTPSGVTVVQNFQPAEAATLQDDRWQLEDVLASPDISYNAAPSGDTSTRVFVSAS